MQIILANTLINVQFNIQLSQGIRCNKLSVSADLAVNRACYTELVFRLVVKHQDCETSSGHPSHGHMLLECPH